MKKTILLSLVTISSLYSDVELSSIQIEATTLQEVAQNAKISADVADALSNNVASIDISRRSAIANDIILRGQKRDNITVEVDGAKVYGACPNRMDPPVSHIVANQIDKVEVIEGPYDVTTFGVLSGGVKIKTTKPSKDEEVGLHIGFGSWNYKKFGITANGGDDILRVSITASTESSNQYRDGDNNNLAQQIDNYVLTHPTLAGTKYQDTYHDKEAYSKKSAMAKVFIKTAKNQELRLSATANRSDNILYPNSKMDAIYDDSNIYNVEYNIDNLSKKFKNLNLKYYHSDVTHPMGTDYRVSSLAPNPVITNALTTDMDGIKIKNSFNIFDLNLLFGIDASKRVWNGHYEKNHSAQAIGYRKSIDNAITKNYAIFSKLSKDINSLQLEIGARYDDTSITNDSFKNNNYNSLGINILSTYNIDEENKLFLGIGQAYRVPDARELYFLSSMGNLIGTPNLNQVKNQEIDFGYEIDNENFNFKIKTFYSKLSNYIYIKKGAMNNAFYNIDAKIYGLELTSSYYINDDITLDTKLSYKNGKKDKALPQQTDTDLADIAPLRGSIALNYEYSLKSMATLEVKASDRWNKIDSDNGEQELSGWAILNTKIQHSINKQFDFTFGINNILNKTYVESNSYADLILISDGSTDVMLMNEAGRYIYTNLDFRF